MESLRTISITHAHLSFVAHAADAIERLSKDSERLADSLAEMTAHALSPGGRLAQNHPAVERARTALQLHKGE